MRQTHAITKEQDDLRHEFCVCQDVEADSSKEELPAKPKSRRKSVSMPKACLSMAGERQPNNSGQNVVYRRSAFIFAHHTMLPTPVEAREGQEAGKAPMRLSHRLLHQHTWIRRRPPGARSKSSDS